MERGNVNREWRKEERIAVFLDFQEFGRLETISELMEELRKLGRISRAMIYVNQDEIDKVREDLPEIAKFGLEPIVTVFSKEVKATLDLVEHGYREDLSVLALGWSVIDALNSPLLEVREQKKVWIIATQENNLEDIKKMADKVIQLKTDKTS